MSRSAVRRLLVVGLTLLALPSAAHAQTGKLTGIVTDAATGRPVEGVAVTVQGTTLGSLTNAAGRYFIIQVPPGNYNVQARRIGFQAVTAANVQITIDATREQHFALKASDQTLAAVTIQADQTPLVERNQVGSQSVVTAEQIRALPVTSIAGVLSLQQGFTEVPANTGVVSLAEETRSTVPAIRVRGSRGGSTLSMVDGIAINNPLFGNDAVSVSTLALQQVNFQRGAMDPQYGNALAGVINQAVREGGAEISGAIEYQNSTIPGSIFGTTQDKLNGLNLLRGYLSGPVPGTSAKLRYSLAGQLESRAARVLEYDTDVYSVNRPANNEDVLPPSQLDLLPGWQRMGGVQNAQFSGKLTFLPFDNTTIKLTGVGSARQSRNFDRRFLFAYRGDPLSLVGSRADSLRVYNDANNRGSQDLIQPSTRDQGSLFVASLEQRWGQSNFQLRVAQTDFERQTCPIFIGTCIPGPFAYGNFTEGFLAICGGFTGCDRVPYQGTASGTFGGEKYTTRTVRADLQSQVTDHTNLQIGTQFVQHDFSYSDLQQDATTTSGLKLLQYQVYRGRPIEAAAYLQGTIEYDFLTVKLGGRFDYGRAAGRGFSNPFDPANGTTAREVCEGATVGGRRLLDASGQPYGLQRCGESAVSATTQRPELIDSAAAIAQLDDFRDAPSRIAFSPRIGVSFPLSERSQVFFNAGRYTMIPLYGNTYRNTGIGTVAGPADRYCAAGEVKPGTNECVPNIEPDNPTFAGNPSLQLEQAKQFEVGYAGEVSRNYSIQVAVFNRSETGLSGIRPSRAVQDIGSTYGSAFPSYSILVNGDFVTSRGVEVQFRRRLADRWGFDINYGLSRSTTNSRPPERADEVTRTDESARQQLVETVTDIDQPHRFNTQLFYQIRKDIPNLPYGLGRALRDARISLTYSFVSGIPYTPLRSNGFSGVGVVNSAEVNSGRQPATQTVDLLTEKQFNLRNVGYSLFLRVNNLLDRRNCVQVFPNTGTCDTGIRDFVNRRIGNAGGAQSSTSFDLPEYVGSRRSIATGLSVTF